MARPRQTARCFPAFFLLILWGAVAGCAAGMADPRNMRFEPVTVTEPNVETVHLDNGLTVYLLPDSSIPLITVNAIIEIGNIDETPDQVGLAGMTTGLMRDGGAGELNTAEFDQVMAHRAIQMSSSAGREYSRARVNSLTRVFPEALARFADMLRRPRFDAARLEDKKANAIDSIRRENESPMGIARRELNTAIAGKGHPMARNVTIPDIEKIRRDDVVEFHRRFYTPGNIHMGVTGNFERDAMLQMLTDAFGDWSGGPTSHDPIPPLPPDGPRHVLVAHRDLNQASIRMGHLSVRRDHPDYYALQLANHIFGGGGFDSRLFKAIRTREGLAYQVGANLFGGHKDRGMFTMVVKTSTDEARRTVELMLAELERLRNEPISEQELAEAKESISNGIVFSSVTAEKVMRRYMGNILWDLPENEMTLGLEATLALTVEDVTAAVRRHLHPDRLIVVAVGDAKVLKPALADFGEVSDIILTHH